MNYCARKYILSASIAIGVILTSLLYILPLKTELQIIVDHTHPLSTIGMYLSTLFCIPCFYFGILYLRDQETLRKRQLTQGKIALNQQGIKVINRTLNLECQIIHEDDHFGSWAIYSSHLSNDYLDQLRKQYIQHESLVEENQEGIPRRAEDYLDVRTLTHLPELLDRKQVGLFATRAIPAWSLVYWTGDIGVMTASEQNHISEEVLMNRRTLFTIDGVKFFQGGSTIQRSGCGVLANFFWCNTKTTDAHQSDYRILPPNYLGHPNCVYVTTLKEGQVCSALLSYADIKQDEQILMFTGTSHDMQSIERRLRYFRMIPLLVFISVFISFFQLYLRH